MILSRLKRERKRECLVGHKQMGVGGGEGGGGTYSIARR
jgi:hypothetical protein